MASLSVSWLPAALEGLAAGVLQGDVCVVVQLSQTDPDPLGIRDREPEVVDPVVLAVDLVLRVLGLGQAVMSPRSMAPSLVASGSTGSSVGLLSAPTPRRCR